MNLREALSYHGEFYQRKAIEEMTIEDYFVALKDVNSPEFSKVKEELKPKLEVLLRAKIDQRDAAKADASSKKADASLKTSAESLRTARLALGLSALAVILSLLFRLLRWP